MILQTRPMTFHEQFFPRYNMLQAIKIIQTPQISQPPKFQSSEIVSIPNTPVLPTINLTDNPFPKPSLLKGIGTHLGKYGVYYLIGGAILLLIYNGYQSQKEEEKLNALARG